MTDTPDTQMPGGREKRAAQLTEITNDLRSRERKHAKSFNDRDISGRDILHQLLSEGSVSMLEYLQVEPAVRQYMNPFMIDPKKI